MEVADYLSESGIPVYMYLFSQGTKTWGIESSIPLGAVHAEDLQFVFGQTDLVEPLPGTTHEELRALSASVVKAWTTFAKGEYVNYLVVYCRFII